MRRTALVLLVVGLIGLLAGGCVRLLEPRPSNTKYYLLESDATAASETNEGLRVGLRKPRLAEYLNTPTIVTRQGENEIVFSEFHRWGEDLSAAINRVVSRNVETQPSIQSTEVVPWSRGATFDYVVQLRILRFEGIGPPPPGPDADKDAPVPKGRSQMTVTWTVFGPEGDSVRARGETKHRLDGWPVTDYSNLVSKLNASLVVLAEDIAEQLRTLSRSTE